MLKIIYDDLQVGITIAARKYDFNSATPFQTSDVLDLRPVVKHSVPLCSEAKELVETGKLQLAEVISISTQSNEHRYFAYTICKRGYICMTFLNVKTLK